jgi:isoleucyl-tRNA synthetase
VLVQALLDDVSDELNVKLLQPLDAGNEVIDVAVKPNFRKLGKRLGKQTQQVATAILAVQPQTVVDGIRHYGAFHVSVAERGSPSARTMFW